MALSAERILRLLQDNPDLVVELKSQMADRMSEQGMQIDENDISDQMLFSQIAESAPLRVRITAYLRARGYVTDSDIEASQLEDVTAASSARSSLMQGASGLSGNSGLPRYPEDTTMQNGMASSTNQRRWFTAVARPSRTSDWTR